MTVTLDFARMMARPPVVRSVGVVRERVGAVRGPLLGFVSPGAK
jgi:hypothetical protein